MIYDTSLDVKSLVVQWHFSKVQIPPSIIVTIELSKLYKTSLSGKIKPY